MKRLAIILVTISLLLPFTGPASADSGAGIQPADLGNPRTNIVRLFWHQATTLPQLLTEEALTAPSPAPESPQPGGLAQTFLQSDAAALNLKKGAEQWEIVSTMTDNLGTSHVRLRQTYSGLPVFGADMVVHITNGRVAAVNGVYPDAINISTGAQLDQEEAFNIAVQKLHINAPVLESGSLVIYNPAVLNTLADSENHLAYMLAIEQQDPTDSLTVFVDVNTGSVLQYYSNWPTVKNRQINDLDGSMTLPGTLIYNESGPVVPSPSQDATDAYNFTGDTYDYYFDTFGRDSYNGSGATMLASVRYGTISNAFWNNSQTVFGPGFAVNDVVAHEWTHAVTQYTADLIYSYQPGALNEAFSDIFGAMVDRDDWLIGEDIPGITGGAIRSLADPTLYGNPGKVSDYVITDDDYGGVHTNCGIPEHAVYLMAEGGTYNGRTITGIGREATERICYRALTVYLTSSANFLDAYNAFRSAASDLFGNGSVTYNNVTSALQAVEMDQTVPGPEPGTPDAYEPDDVYSQASTITVDGDIQAHNFHYTADNDWVKFTATAGTGYVFQTSNLGSRCDTYMYLYDTDGVTEITHDDNSGFGLASCIVWTAPSSATYYVRLRHSGSAYGTDTNYDFSVAIGSGIDLTVLNHNGLPAADAHIQVYTDINQPPLDTKNAADQNGHLFLPLPQGDYSLLVSSYSGQFCIVRENVPSPSSLTLNAANETVPVTVTACKKDQTPLTGAALVPSPSYYSIGDTGASGTITVYLTPRLYQKVFIWDMSNLYYLYQPDVNVTGPAFNLDFKADQMPTGICQIDFDDFTIGAVVPFLQGIYLYPIFFLNDGASITMSTGVYGSYFALQKTGADQSTWWFALTGSTIDVTTDATVTARAGGDFSAMATPDKDSYEPGNTARLDLGIFDNYGNRVYSSYIYSPGVSPPSSADIAFLEEGAAQPVPSKDYQAAAATLNNPTLRITRPDDTVYLESAEFNYDLLFQLPPDAMEGTWTVTYSFDTGPHRGVILAENHFHVGKDITAPVITTCFPADGASDIPVDTGVYVSFSEAMDQASLQNAFTIEPAVSGTFAWNVDSSNVTFTPDDDLDYNTLYTVTIGTGATDPAGNALAAPCSWSFTTAKSPPTVSTNSASTIGADQATLNMTFDFKDYSSGNVSFVYRESGGSPKNTTLVARSGSGTYAETITGLKGHTIYYFKARLDYNSTVIEGAEASFETINTPPSAAGVGIMPDPAYTNDDLMAVPSGWYDTDGDPENYLYHWQKYDGATWRDIPGTDNKTLASASFVRYDQIKIVCTPFDGADAGTPVEAAITISNSPPAAPVTDVTPDLPLTFDNLECAVKTTSTDADDDPITYTYQWYKNDATIPDKVTTATTDLVDTLSSALTGSGETWRCVVVPNDGIINGTSAQDQVTIAVSRTEPVTDDVLDAITEADTEVAVAGSANVTVAKYAGNPGATSFDGDIDKYIDIYVDDATAVNELEIRLYYTDAEISGKVESSLKLHWWDGAAWLVCSDSSVNMTDGNGYSGYIWAKIRSDTTPTLADLTGTPFGAAASPQTTGGNNAVSIGGVVGGGGAVAAGEKSITPIRGSLNSQFKAIEDIDAWSVDLRAGLLIDFGTKVVNRAGGLITAIEIEKLVETPSVGQDQQAVSAAYDFRPGGARFEPPISLTLKYTRDSLPAGVSESNLYIAQWNQENSQWERQDSQVDTVKGFLTASISHFSTYAVMADTRPADFAVNDLKIEPATIKPNEALSISAVVTNIGDLSGSYDTILKIDNAVAQAKTVTLDGGSSQMVSFSLTPDAAGKHDVNIGDLSAVFEVKAPEGVPPTTPAAALTVTPTPASAPTPIPASTPAPTPTTTLAATPAPPATPPVGGLPVQPSATNWSIIGGIIAAGVVIIGLAVYFLVRRRKAW